MFKATPLVPEHSHPLNPKDAEMLKCHKGYRGCLWDPPRHELEEGLQWVVECQRAGEAAKRGGCQWGQSQKSLSPTASDTQGLVYFYFISATAFGM